MSPNIFGGIGSRIFWDIARSPTSQSRAASSFLISPAVVSGRTDLAFCPLDLRSDGGRRGAPLGRAKKVGFGVLGP